MPIMKPFLFGSIQINLRESARLRRQQCNRLSAFTRVSHHLSIDNMENWSALRALQFLRPLFIVESDPIELREWFDAR